MSQIAKLLPFAALGILILTTAGCGNDSVVSAKTLSEHRSRLALAEEPDGIQTVADVRRTLLGESEPVHEDHDHDGDGIQDHAPEDHKPEHDHDAHDHDAHDHDAHDEHDHAEHDAHDHAEHAHATEAQEVTVVGHVGGLVNPWGKTQPEFPFAKSKAVFFLADPQAVIENEASGHVHAPGEECAFCEAHAKDNADMLAMVQFVDKKGDVLPMDVRQLFDVKVNDTVVVHGKARVTEGGILVVDAEGLYIRK